MVARSEIRPAGTLADDDADAVFRALADGTRRDIVRRTLVGEESISVLAERYDMSFAAVQKHVAVLDRCGLVTKRRRGKEQLVRARIETVERTSRLLGEYERIWRDRVGRIDALLFEDGAGRASGNPPRTALDRDREPDDHHGRHGCDAHHDHDDSDRHDDSRTTGPTERTAP